jgi:squalene synthase HpnC
VQDRPLDDAGPQKPVLVAVAATIRSRQLPVELFEDLLSAFAQDVTVTRYERWDDLLDYCRRSANPVGRLVLRICGYRDPQLDHASDCVCTALQLANFWQDLSRDWAIGRLYVPRELWQPANARIEHFNPRALDAAWQQALASAASRTDRLFDEGRSVCDGVSGRLRYELRLTWLGGKRILERTRRSWRAGVHRRPALGVADVMPLAYRFAAWRLTAARVPAAAAGSPRH